jgi:hypothetical protein
MESVIRNMTEFCRDCAEAVTDIKREVDVDGLVAYKTSMTYTPPARFYSNESIHELKNARSSLVRETEIRSLLDAESKLLDRLMDLLDRMVHVHRMLLKHEPTCPNLELISGVGYSESIMFLSKAVVYVTNRLVSPDATNPVSFVSDFDLHFQKHYCSIYRIIVDADRNYIPDHDRIRYVIRELSGTRCCGSNNG